MPRLYNKAVRDVCGALRHEGVMPKEIERRLHNNEAGLDGPVLIKERRIYEYIADYNEEHGPPPTDEDEDQTSDSITRLKRRAVALIAREIVFLEKKRIGSLSVKQSAALRQHFATLDDMERREVRAAKQSRARPGNPSSQQGSNGDQGNESAIERLAREQGESEASATRSDNPPSQHRTQEDQATAQRGGDLGGEDIEDEAGDSDQPSPTRASNSEAHRAQDQAPDQHQPDASSDAAA